MLEAYQAYGDYDTMATLVQDLVVAAARAVDGTVVTARDGSAIDLAAAGGMPRFSSSCPRRSVRR